MNKLHMITMALLLLSLMGVGGAVKEVPVPDCGNRIEYVSNASEFTIGSFGSGNKDAFVLAINSSSFNLEGVKVKISNSSVVFQTKCADCSDWETIQTEEFTDAIILHFVFYNEICRGGDVPVIGNFKSANGKDNGFFYVVSQFKIDTTGVKVWVSYESIDP